MKKLFETLSRKIGFTPNEGKIVFVLVIVFVLGGAIKLWRISNEETPAFDYREQDSLFAEKSRLIGSTGENLTAGMNDTVSVNSALTQNKSDTTTGKLNINTASKEDLMKLPGIGDAMAERIILYREEQGVFTSLEQMLHVRGIGEKKLEQLKPLLRLTD